MVSNGKTALFVEAEGDGTIKTLLAAGKNNSILEELLPGGWADYDNVQNRRWILLAGTLEAFQNFGLKEGLHSNGRETTSPDPMEGYLDMNFKSAWARDILNVDESLKACLSNRDN